MSNLIKYRNEVKLMFVFCFALFGMECLVDLYSFFLFYIYMYVGMFVCLKIPKKKYFFFLLSIISTPSKTIQSNDQLHQDNNKKNASLFNRTTCFNHWYILGADHRRVQCLSSSAKLAFGSFKSLTHATFKQLFISFFTFHHLYSDPWAFRCCSSNSSDSTFQLK